MIILIICYSIKCLIAKIIFIKKLSTKCLFLMLDELPSRIRIIIYAFHLSVIVFQQVSQSQWYFLTSGDLNWKITFSFELISLVSRRIINIPRIIQTVKLLFLFVVHRFRLVNFGVFFKCNIYPIRKETFVSAKQSNFMEMYKLDHHGI